jgi:hypothetical protein
MDNVIIDKQATITKLLAMSEDGRTDVDDKNGHQHSEGNRNKHIKDIIK